MAEKKKGRGAKRAALKAIPSGAAVESAEPECHEEPEIIEPPKEEEKPAFERISSSGKPAAAKKIKIKGSKEEVYAGLASKTGGGLKAEDLMQNEKGKIVSKKKHELGKQHIQRLHPAKEEPQQQQNNEPQKSM